MAKQAILIMAHNRAEQLKYLIEYFKGQCDVFIHLDKKGNFTKLEREVIASLPGVKKVISEINVHWGGYSLLRCQMLLFKTALKYSDFRYAHLLSGQDYPTRPLEDFLETFDKANEEYIGWSHLPSPGWDNNTLWRIQHFFLNDFYKFPTEEDVRKIWNFTAWQRKMGIKRRIPDQVDHLYGGSAWFSLTRACCNAVVEYTQNHPSLYRRMNFTFAPDEIYINTVVHHVDYPGKKLGNTNYRFVKWVTAGDNHPKTLTENDFYEISSSNAFFARKITTPNSNELMEKIEKYMLRKEELSKTSTGAWTTQTLYNHFYDEGLADGIVSLCKTLDISKTIDLGCGAGWYIMKMRSNSISAIGCDGNPSTPDLTSVVLNKTQIPCSVVDLTNKLVFESTYQLSLCISVGEYIPKEYEKIVFDNLVSSTTKYLIISWNHDGLRLGVVNPHTPKYIESKMMEYGFRLNPIGTRVLRNSAWTEYNKKEVMLFEK